MNIAAQTAAAKCQPGRQAGRVHRPQLGRPQAGKRRRLRHRDRGSEGFFGTAEHGPAGQGPPPEPPRRSIRSVLAWSLLGAAIAAALGAAGVVIRQRYQAAIAADTEVDEAGETPAPADAAKTDSAPEAGTSTDAGVNGRVSASGLLTSAPQLALTDSEVTIGYGLFVG